MKKLFLLLLILLTTNLFGQQNINWYRITFDTSSTLNYNPLSSGNVVKMSYYNVNPVTGVQHKYVGNNTWVVDSAFKNSNTSTNLTINGTSNVYSPEQFGAIKANQTFAQRGINQDTINKYFPGIGATTSDYVDWAAWQMAVKAATTNGGTIQASGGIYYLGPKSITLEKYSKYFQLDGSYAKLVSTGTTPIITRPSPTSSSDALLMNNLRCTIRNLVLDGTSTQIGIDIGPTYGAYYQNITGQTLGENIHIRFGLRTTVDNCFSTNSNIGWIADKGNWPGATSSNSQSNHTTFRSCRYFGSGDIAFGVYYSSGCLIEDCIIEGSSVRVGIDFNGFSSTVVKDFTVRNTHFECTNGATEAFIKVRMHSGLVTIDKVFGQYSSILADIGATVGFMTAEISHVSYWVSDAGKYFNNAGNVGWIFKYNELPFVTTTASTTIPNWFNGTPVQNCGGPGCGSNRFTYIGIPR